ncbi:N-acetyltransferase [Roseovarius faecimaris]|uniref:N-acetyltransferase n=1 Tax=Roseovarius faecimaris TaxID=2494550 RepID=A0A6I6IL78_9RHOB|nr:GNAT family N-acetyltransferase [Roseovarius faecimaris]QGX97800.1 N-acetyltransferase [Roseovarius faecimaris]
MIVRDARAADTPAIAEIWNHNIRHTANTFTTAEKTPEGLARDIETRRAEGKGFLVAEDGKDIVGFATYFQFRGGPGYAFTAEHSVMLAEAAMGKGTGRALMEALEAHARGAGMHSLIAGVAGENAAGIAFHAALGYRTIAVLPEVGRKFERWMDLTLMQKML